MAIIVDPDNIDRRQIIFSSDQTREVSIYPVGSIVGNVSGTTGYVTGSSFIFSDVSASFVTSGVLAGDILCLFTDRDAGHYIIDSVAQKQLTIDADSWLGNRTRTNFLGSTTDNVVYQILISYLEELERVFFVNEWYKYMFHLQVLFFF
jgi:hypothetical protein